MDLMRKKKSDNKQKFVLWREDWLEYNRQGVFSGALLQRERERDKKEKQNNLLGGVTKVEAMPNGAKIVIGRKCDKRLIRKICRGASA